MLHSTFEFLTREALAQPQVFVHRDYHARNLMRVPHANPGVIDFQDALRGPVGYDLVSLLKDCYIAWPRGTRGRLGARLSRAACSRRRRRRCGCVAVPALVRPDRRAAARQGARDLLPPVVPRRQVRLPPGPAAHARPTCARAARCYPELAPFGEFLEARVVPQLAVRPGACRGAAARRGAPP